MVSEHIFQEKRGLNRIIEKKNMPLRLLSLTSHIHMHFCMYMGLYTFVNVYVMKGICIHLCILYIYMYTHVCFT